MTIHAVVMMKGGEGGGGENNIWVLLLVSQLSSLYIPENKPHRKMQTPINTALGVSILTSDTGHDR